MGAWASFYTVAVTVGNSTTAVNLGECLHKCYNAVARTP